MSMGKMTAFMDTHENEHLDSPIVQIPARTIIAPNDPDNMVRGGFFQGEKKLGLNGTDGVMALTDRQSALPRFFLQFACPYTRNNGVNVAIDETGSRSPRDLSPELWDGRGLDKQVTSGKYTFQARCNSTRGGVAAGIAILSAPPA
jgi:hypothetical protein